MEVRQSGETEAEDRPGDRQPGRQDDGSDPAVHGVVGRFRILTGLTRFLIATEKKYAVIGSGRDA